MQPRMSPAAPRVGQLLTDGRTVLSESTAIDHWRASIAREDAADLLALALVVETDALDPKALVPARLARRYLEFLLRRAAGEPVALIRGVVEFAGLTPVGAEEFVKRLQAHGSHPQAVPGIGYRRLQWHRTNFDAYRQLGQLLEDGGYRYCFHVENTPQPRTPHRQNVLKGAALRFIEWFNGGKHQDKTVVFGCTRPKDKQSLA